MPNANVCQLIVDPPADGAWNMAVDEALLATAAETGIPTLRFYQWLRPTLSLGYFQQNADRQSHPASLEAEVVRRLSGGGAILHDQELTYSLVLPTDHSLAKDTQALYQTIHKAIVRYLADLISKSTAPWQPTQCVATPQSNSRSEPFLCFRRRSTGDVLLEPTEGLPSSENHKIVGSAQRRRRGAILQHGSILLTRSDAAPELLGFTDLTGIPLVANSAADCLQLAFAEALAVKLETSCFSDSVGDLAKKILLQRYGNSSWLERR
ncbi:MAG: lipoate--protein ligase [Planctomycetes bacterium]|nr:lipoate--protein ligase [Planctomycetota bacterium]